MLRGRLSVLFVAGAAAAWTIIHGGCSSSSAIPGQDSGPPGTDTGVATEIDGSISAPDTSSPFDASAECRSEFVPAAECKHPAIQPRCSAGYCIIPAGCFVMGSPTCQLNRGANNEAESQVTLTHAFEIGQHPLVSQPWAEALRSGEGRGPLTEGFARYFVGGTFDAGDIVAALVGSLAAVFVLRLSCKKAERNHAT